MPQAWLEAYVCNVKFWTHVTSLNLSLVSLGENFLNEAGLNEHEKHFRVCTEILYLYVRQ